MPEPPRRKRSSERPDVQSGVPNPMEEENFPTESPTRRAVERDMREPSNVRGPSSPIPRRDPPLKEAEDREEAEPKE